jgi:hypothetical protein
MDAARGSREVAEALGFEPDNHHNATVCPYCTHNGAFVMVRREAISEAVDSERERIAQLLDKEKEDRRTVMGIPVNGQPNFPLIVANTWAAAARLVRASKKEE